MVVKGPRRHDYYYHDKDLLRVSFGFGICRGVGELRRGTFQLCQVIAPITPRRRPRARQRVFRAKLNLHGFFSAWASGIRKVWIFLAGEQW